MIVLFDRMTVDNCIDAYVSLLDRVFQKRRCWLGNKDGFKRTNSKELERAIKEIIIKQELEEDALLRDKVDIKCKISLAPIGCYIL